jgi:hypothetical protein
MYYNSLDKYSESLVDVYIISIYINNNEILFLYRCYTSNEFLTLTLLSEYTRKKLELRMWQ